MNEKKQINHLILKQSREAASSILDDFLENVWYRDNEQSLALITLIMLFPEVYYHYG